MVTDLAMTVEIRGCETIREPDGLAMSSRNRYMSVEEREQAVLIYQGMSAAKASWEAGERVLETLQKSFLDVISRCPRMVVQYAEIVDKTSLEPAGAKVADKDLILIVAVLFGDVRLIDNLEF
jgi:pantoate--beta-alanine ligase